MILIDYKDRRPIYEQVIEKLQQMILCGALEPNSSMPSVRNLAMELSLNPNTIQRAYQELERSGYIYTVKGKGSFVSDAALVADNKRRKAERGLKECIDKAMLAGISADEIIKLVKSCIERGEQL